MSDAAAPEPPYIGICEDCGAKHEVGDETTSCMCGGEIRPRTTQEA